jgi:hypothetical protein
MSRNVIGSPAVAGVDIANEPRIARKPRVAPSLRRLLATTALAAGVLAGSVPAKALDIFALKRFAFDLNRFGIPSLSDL